MVHEPIIPRKSSIDFETLLSRMKRIRLSVHAGGNGRRRQEEKSGRKNKGERSLMEQGRVKTSRQVHADCVAHGLSLAKLAYIIQSVDDYRVAATSTEPRMLVFVYCRDDCFKEINFTWCLLLWRRMHTFVTMVYDRN